MMEQVQLQVAPDLPMSDSDKHAVLRLIEPFARGDRVDVAVIDGEPISKARARFTSKGKPYTPKVTVAGEMRLAAMLASIPTYPGNVVVGCIFYRSSRQRIDLDNLLKAVLDASTRAHVWTDDSQVTAILALLEHDHDRPRTIIALAPHVSSMTRGDDALVSCEFCGTRFFPAGQRRDKARWCSRECRARLAKPIPCAACGKPFRRRSGNQKYCSNTCRGVGYTRAKANEREQRVTCSKGHELTPDNVYRMPNGGRRCRACQAESAQIYRSLAR